MTLLQHHIVALSFTAITTLILGLLVFLANPKRRLNQVFALYSLAIVWWASTEAFLVGSTSQTIANFWSYVEWPAVFFIAPTFVHTIFLAAEKTEAGTGWVPRIGYIVSIVFVTLHLFTNWLTSYPRPDGYALFHNRVTFIGSLIPLTFLILVNVALVRLWRACRETVGQRKIQLEYLFWGSVIGYLGGSPDWLFVFGLCIPPLNPFGIYGVPLYSVATTYAVLQHRLFDVNLVIRKSLICSILVTTLTVGYFGIIYAIERMFQITFGYQSWVLSLLAFALMALFFQPLKLGIQRIVDWLIFRVPQEELIRRIERLEREARETEKLRAVATMAAGLCHELRNPLQVIQTHAEFLPERYNDPDFRQKCSEALRTETKRINVLLKELMEFAKPKPAKLRSIEPHVVLDSTLNLLNADLLKHKITLERQYRADGAKILADPDQIRQVVLNLILNAMQAIGQEGNIVVTTRQDGVWFVLEVQDTGPGIPSKILSKLFQPFNTTKEDGNGLGLSVSHSIIQSHQGRISVESKPGEGTCFTVKLPLD